MNAKVILYGTIGLLAVYLLLAIGSLGGMSVVLYLLLVPTSLTAISVFLYNRMNKMLAALIIGLLVGLTLQLTFSYLFFSIWFGSFIFVILVMNQLFKKEKHFHIASVIILLIYMVVLYTFGEVL